MINPAAATYMSGNIAKGSPAIAACPHLSVSHGSGAWRRARSGIVGFWTSCKIVY